MCASSYLSVKPFNASSAQCTACCLRQLCLVEGLSDPDIARLGQLVGRRRRVQRDEHLFRLGEPFHCLYAVRFGHFKTSQVNLLGEVHVTGFQMPGDLLALDAIGEGRHACNAVALEDSEICELPFVKLQELFGSSPRLLVQFHRVLSNEILREQSVMLFLSNMRAEQRLALFLLDLANRYAARGYSPSAFQLRMSREDMGAYLGLAIESVCRQLARFRRRRWIALTSRDLVILDRRSLEALASGREDEGAYEFDEKRGPRLAGRENGQRILSVA